MDPHRAGKYGVPLPGFTLGDSRPINPRMLHLQICSDLYDNQGKAQVSINTDVADANPFRRVQTIS